MPGLHSRAAGQVGNGARHLERAVGAAGRPAQACGGLVGEGQGLGREAQVVVQGLALELVVGAALALHGQRAGLDHALAHGLAGFARARGQQLLRGQGADFHMQVDAVQQRAADARLVARHLVGRAAAALHRRSPMAAGAGIHGRDELEARGEFAALGGSGDGDLAGLQRLAQRLQRAACELGEFVQKQYSVMGLRDLARARRRASVDYNEKLNHGVTSCYTMVYQVCRMG